MSTKKQVKIKILDKDYTLFVENEERAQKVGDYINGLMNYLRDDLADQPTQTVAVLVSLNIANEMFAERDELMNLFKDLTQKVENLNSMVEEVL